MLSCRCPGLVSGCVHKDLFILHIMEAFTTLWLRQTVVQTRSEPSHFTVTKLPVSVCPSCAPVLSRRYLSYTSNLGHLEIHAGAQSEGKEACPPGDPPPCPSTSHTESARSNIMEKTDGGGFTEQLPSLPTPWRTYTACWLRHSFAQTRAHWATKLLRSHEDWSSHSSSLKLPLLPCKTGVILSLWDLGMEQMRYFFGQNLAQGQSG